MIRLQKETELQAQQVQIERERLSVGGPRKAEAERDAKIAEAEAEKQVIQARADAELYKQEREAQAQLVMTEKEAEAIRLRGQAEADAAFIRAPEGSPRPSVSRAKPSRSPAQARRGHEAIRPVPPCWICSLKSCRKWARAVSEPLSKTEKIILFGEGAASSMVRDTTGTMMQTFEAMKSPWAWIFPKCCGT